MSEEENPMGFVRSKLPWIAGAGAFILFLVTLNHWVNLRSLPTAARIAGWDWSLPVHAPLFYLVTLPIRLFPDSIQPLAMNLLAAVCGALTIVLLARSVALLPHDRTHEQRLRERSDYSLLSIGLAWVPVVLAVACCALQLTFWEHSTAITAEMFDLLVFAYVIRCLLEYRISVEESWLAKMAFVYGLAITNNWAMIAFFPLFLGAVIWMRGIRFFEPAFLVRMVCMGFAGLLLYLLLPFVWMFKGEGEYTFFQVLRSNWASQKAYLVDLPQLRNRVLLLSLTSILPVILMGIRWRSRSGETSAAGANLSNLAFRVIHLFILAACLFVVFDPKYSPRELGLGLPFLTFYYLGALAIGYYSGYALLVFTERSGRSWRRENVLNKALNPVIRAAVLLALVAVPAALAFKNYPRIRASDGSLLKDFVTQIAQGLPQGPAYLLSEDPFQLALLQAHLEGANREKDYVLVNTRSLEAADYHQQMNKHWGERWPLIASKDEIGVRVMPVDLQHLVLNLSKSNSVAYLHPSFGYFFEVLYPQPSGASYLLKPFAAEDVLPPALTEDQLRANDAFWAGASTLIEKAERQREFDSHDARYVMQFFSRGLNTWGVQLQRNGKIPEAGRFFDRAAGLSTNNVPALFNAEFNKAYQKGETTAFEGGRILEQKFGHYRSWDAMLQENGPFDHPELCAILGDGFLSQTQYRQSALQFSRTIFFQPTNLTARLSYAKALVYGNWIEKGMSAIAEIEKDFSAGSPREKADIIALKAAALYTRNEFPQAEQLLKSAQATYPEDGSITQALFELYRVSGKYTNALAVANEQLARSPTNVVVLLQKAELQLNNDDLAGAHATAQEVLKVAPRSAAALLFEAFVFIREGNHAQAQATLGKVLQIDRENVQALLYQGIAHMELKELEKARENFDKVLELQPDNVAALRNRAILNLRAQRWSEAEDDYALLRKTMPRSHAVMFGLAEVAYARKNFVDATRFYELYLKYAPAEATGELLEEKKKVQERLKELKSLAK